MKKHWIQLLGEVGKPLTQRGDIQLHKLFDIEAHQQSINKLRAEYNKEEQELNKIALEYWTADEVAQAKSDTQ